MDKTLQKVTKDPKKFEQGKKSYETLMKRLKEQILKEHQPPTYSSACDPTPSASSTTCNPTPSTSSHAKRSNDTYVYGVGMLAVLTIGVTILTLFLEMKNPSMKDKITHQKDVICFSKKNIQYK